MTKTMLCVCCAILLSLTTIDGLAQVRVHKGSSIYSSDVICTVSEGKVYDKNSSYSSDVLCSIDENKIYRNNSSYSSDVLYTIVDGKVYRRNSGVMDNFNGFSERIVPSGQF